MAELNQYQILTSEIDIPNTTLEIEISNTTLEIDIPTSSPQR